MPQFQCTQTDGADGDKIQIGKFGTVFGFTINKLFYLTKKVMNSLLYLIAVILVIGWIFGFFVYSVGGLIHILLVLAVVAILIRIIGGRSA